MSTFVLASELTSQLITFKTKDLQCLAPAFVRTMSCRVDWPSAGGQSTKSIVSRTSIPILLCTVVELPTIPPFFYDQRYSPTMDRIINVQHFITDNANTFREGRDAIYYAYTSLCTNGARPELQRLLEYLPFTSFHVLCIDTTCRLYNWEHTWFPKHLLTINHQNLEAFKKDFWISSELLVWILGTYIALQLLVTLINIIFSAAYSAVHNLGKVLHLLINATTLVLNMAYHLWKSISSLPPPSASAAEGPDDGSDEDTADDASEEEIDFPDEDVDEQAFEVSYDGYTGTTADAPEAPTDKPEQQQQQPTTTTDTNAIDQAIDHSSTSKEAYNAHYSEPGRVPGETQPEPNRAETSKTTEASSIPSRGSFANARKWNNKKRCSWRQSRANSRASTFTAPEGQEPSATADSQQHKHAESSSKPYESHTSNDTFNGSAPKGNASGRESPDFWSNPTDYMNYTRERARTSTNSHRYSAFEPSQQKAEGTQSPPQSRKSPYAAYSKHQYQPQTPPQSARPEANFQRSRAYTKPEYQSPPPQQSYRPEPNSHRSSTYTKPQYEAPPPPRTASPPSPPTRKPVAFNPYAVMSLERTASLSQIKSTYKKLALKYHPDKNAPSEQLAAKEAFQLVQQAYEILSNDISRAIYHLHGLKSLKNPQTVEHYEGLFKERKEMLAAYFAAGRMERKYFGMDG